MADLIQRVRSKLFNRYIPSSQIGSEIENIVKTLERQRKPFERRWYDNNFFDDGYHYRFISRTTGRIVDLTQDADTFIPKRAIPKASRQIRGVANLLLSNELKPVVYPEKISKSNYPDPNQYQRAMAVAKNYALKTSTWVKKEWLNQELDIKLILMVLLAAKHGVSYVQVWPDPVEEKIKTDVYDAFEIYLSGEMKSIYDSPEIIKAIPILYSQIQANENFDQDQVNKIYADNRYAASETKEAYMRTRYGAKMGSEVNKTLILKEAFIKEYLSNDNWAEASKQADEQGMMEGKSKGDQIIRQVFSCNSVTIRDKYVNLPEYPFVDFRFEPGPIYQVPLIERFMPANKSMDSVVSRVERIIGTMAVGAWIKRRGENFEINNQSGGQIIEYDTNPPVQAVMAPIAQHVFQFIDLLSSFIEEQGATTAALGQLPTGVKSGIAIESLKATEYANLKIATMQLKKTVKNITERMLDIAANHFISPQTVYMLENGTPSYFDIIGEKGMKAYQRLAQSPGSGVKVPDAIPIKKDYKVDIEMESGLGFTEEGKRTTMTQIIEFMISLAKEGLLTQEAVKLVIQRFMEVFQFGSMQEFMEAMNTGTPTQGLNNDQLMQMKIAVLEAMKEAGEIGPQASEKRVMENKVGTLEALKESGVIDKMGIGQKPQETKTPSESIGFKDLPVTGQAQMAAQAGIQVTPEELAQHQQVQKQEQFQQQQNQHQQQVELLKMKGVKNAVNVRKQ